MSRQLVVRPEAERDIAEAFRWYEERQAGLGSRFLEAVEAAKTLIEQHRQLFSSIHKEVRRALTKRFPFGVFYLWRPSGWLYSPFFTKPATPSGGEAVRSTS